MKFYWLQQQIYSTKLITEWKEGKTNRADYFSKHHLPSHYNKNKSNYTINT